MESIYLALLLLAMVYVPIWLYTKISPNAKDHGLVAWGPAVMIKTKIGIKSMGKLSKYKRFWRICGLASRVVTLFLMAYIVVVLIIDLILLPFAMGKGGIGIEYALAIPGINPMLPLVYGWIGLVVAMCVHELAHGIQTRANDMEVVSSGLLYGVVPLGAFVEPQEEQLKTCKRRAKIDVYAAGITTNFVVAVICFSLMAGLVGGCTNVDNGDNAAVFGTTFGNGGDHIPNSGIIITMETIEGENSPDNMTKDEFMKYMEENHCGEYNLTYLYKGEKNEIRTWMGVYINQVVKGSPADGKIQVGDYLKSITVQTDETYELGTINQWSNVMDKTHEGDIVCITVVRNGELQSPVEITLAKKEGTDNKGYLGVATTDSGYNFVTPNMIKNSALNPFYGQNDLIGYATGFFTFIGMPFQGFSPVPVETQWWFHNTTFLPDDVFWIVISVLFWIFWLNIVLAVTNALPAVPFDGGFLYAGGIDWIYEKMGVKDERERTRKVNQIVGFTSSFAIVVLIMVMFVIIV